MKTCNGMRLAGEEVGDVDTDNDEEAAEEEEEEEAGPLWSPSWDVNAILASGYATTRSTTRGIIFTASAIKAPGATEEPASFTPQVSSTGEEATEREKEEEEEEEEEEKVVAAAPDAD